MKKLHILCMIFLLVSQPLFAREVPIDRGAIAPEIQNREGNIEGQIENSKLGQLYQQEQQKHDDVSTMDRDSLDRDEDAFNLLDE